MRILITGGKGQLGTALPAALTGHEVTAVDVDELDITSRDAVFAAVSTIRPDLLIHCAAYTNVDGCARDPALAYRVNGLGTQNVALACQQFGAEMVHISTNEVFSGQEPGGYEEWMARSPVNVYGRSKAAAEVHVQNFLNRYYIVRTAWLYAPGGRNFIHAILNRARETGQVRVVTDEIGNPTYVNDLAEAIARLIETHQYGIYHFVNSGACSRWQFANEILRLTGLTDVVNIPILSREFIRPSTPPPFGVLHNIAGAALGITLRPWPEALADYMSRDA
ncbi:MAG: dTDP-4-dehydrorhamnose reductase [Chloroflexi bacterium]|nr:dTDP-4-dehydrorhamnose reductase [Ardenticatenaceae bacterium]MBL1129668.1 dTDP-4-dehydrorhamnose reductase [Chloroflexota bacterium]NOG35748.1 dTDP-4-dehydrorhamnose reductase [Chloroflexota bacterium]GIK56424.1 MAG: NAD(P)-dependent oxidoreductase [Chloroflexota bacterium]